MHSFFSLVALPALAAALPHAHVHSPLHARLELGLSPIAGRADAPALSPVGVCGGDSGFTCGDGFCCSQWGYCGQTTDYCGVGCQFGSCDGSKETPTGSGSAANSTGSLLPAATLGSNDVVTSVVLNVAQVTEYHTVTGFGPQGHGPPSGFSSAASSPAETHGAESPASSAPASSAYTPPAPSTTLTTAYSTSAWSSAAPTQAPPASSVWSSSSASASSSTSAPPPTQSSNSGGKGDTYTMYTGDGTVSEGWPSEDEWMDFDSLWETNMQYISISCINSFNVPNNSDDESSDLKAAIQSVASSTGVDARFVLAIVMQESKGCVRAPTTSYSVRNPGLMQSHDGTGTCNDSGSVQNPCPQSDIQQMINDGTAGVQGAYGLEQNLQQTSASDVSKFYKAARIYNSGSVPSSGDLGAAGATRCYASDIANRLTGWVTAPEGCHLS